MGQISKPQQCINLEQTHELHFMNNIAPLWIRPPECWPTTIRLLCFPSSPPTLQGVGQNGVGGCISCSINYLRLFEKPILNWKHSECFPTTDIKFCSTLCCIFKCTATELDGFCDRPTGLAWARAYIGNFTAPGKTELCQNFKIK